MFIPTPLEQQYEQAASDDVRVLVVGAGIAGVTLAQLLRRDGRHPVLIERAADAPAAGYMLALMPMVDGAIDDLGARAPYEAASVSLQRYGVHGHTGRRLREDPMAKVLDRFGDYRGIARGALLEVLSGDGCPVTFGATATGLHEDADVVEASISTPDTAVHREFDLVVIADGIHSATRDMVLEYPVETVDTDWGGWVVWAPLKTPETPDGTHTTAKDSDLVDEVWGAGFFAGMYPVAGEIGVFLGGPRADTASGPGPFVESVRRSLTTTNPRLERALTAVVEDPSPYYWPMTDCRAPAWATARTVLLGDAAAGFLPTAGVGAGMAMESAWVLSCLMSEIDRRGVPDTLRVFEDIQRPRVESAQDNSRQLAKLMFSRSRVLAVMREIALRVIPLDWALRPIQRLLRDRPDRTQLVRTVRERFAAVRR